MTDAEQTMQSLVLKLINDADRADISRSVSAANIGSMFGAFGMDATQLFAEDAIAQLGHTGRG